MSKHKSDGRRNPRPSVSSLKHERVLQLRVPVHPQLSVTKKQSRVCSAQGGVLTKLAADLSKQRQGRGRRRLWRVSLEAGLPGGGPQEDSRLHFSDQRLSVKWLPHPHASGLPGPPVLLAQWVLSTLHRCRHTTSLPGEGMCPAPCPCPQPRECVVWWSLTCATRRQQPL